MLLSDLLGLEVAYGTDAPLGRVCDVRFRRGPRHGEREGDLELVALIVSPRSRMSFYGYERGTVQGPAVIAAIVRWMHRRSRIVPWECVAQVDRDRVVLGVRPPVIPLDTRRPIDASQAG